MRTGRRRLFVLSTAVLLVASAALAQVSSAASPDVGYLAGGPTAYFDALRKSLRELGYVEGKNINFQVRSARNEYGQLPRLAAELVALHVKVIIAVGTPAGKAAKAATSTIPIVVIGAGDPVGSGLVTSLARPGGNVTGTSNLSPPLMIKRLQLLKEIDPAIARVGVLINPANPAQHLSVEAMKPVAHSLKIDLEQFEARDPGEIDRAISSMATHHVAGLVIANETLFHMNASTIAERAAKRGIRSSGTAEFAAAGGLIGYGSVLDVHRHAATYVDKILKGMKPSDLPVEQPSHLEMVLNVRTAKELGIALSPAVTLHADRMIE